MSRFHKAAVLAFVAAAATAPATGRANDFAGPYAAIEAGLAVLKTDGTRTTGAFKASDDIGTGNVVLGIRSNLKEGLPVTVGFEASVGGYTKGAGLRYGASGIAGVRIAGSGLAYVRAGYTSLDSVDTALNQKLDGIHFGGGYEQRLFDRVHLRADYRYTDLGTARATNTAINAKSHEVTGALVYAF